MRADVARGDFGTVIAVDFEGGMRSAQRVPVVLDDGIPLLGLRATSNLASLLGSRGGCGDASERDGVAVEADVGVSGRSSSSTAFRVPTSSLTDARPRYALTESRNGVDIGADIGGATMVALRAVEGATTGGVSSSSVLESRRDDEADNTGRATFAGGVGIFAAAAAAAAAACCCFLFRATSKRNIFGEPSLYTP